MMVMSIYISSFCGVEPPHGLDFGFCDVFLRPKRKKKKCWARRLSGTASPTGYFQWVQPLEPVGSTKQTGIRRIE